DHGHCGGRLNPQLAAVERDNSTAGFFEQVVPFRDRTFAPLGQRRSGTRRVTGYSGKTSLPRFCAAERFASDFDEERSAFADSGNASRKKEGLATRFDSHTRRDRDQLRFEDGARRYDAVPPNPRLNDLAIVDQRGPG